MSSFYFIFPSYLLKFVCCLALPCLAIYFIVQEGPVVVHVREIPFSYGKLGGSVWMASIALSQYLSMNPSIVQKKRILELGSGVGLLGITISKLGAAHVTMSEYGSEEGVVDGPIRKLYNDDDKRLIPSALLTNLQFNANLNLQQENISIQRIDWYDYLSEEIISVQCKHNSIIYDLIVGSDLINWEDDIEALIATLQYYMKSHKTKVLLSSQIQNRKGLPLFLKRLQEIFPQVETEEFYVQHYETHPILLIKLSL
jgi:predicted nicotinamide N-methyase